jgi:hypothetical protein
MNAQSSRQLKTNKARNQFPSLSAAAAALPGEGGIALHTIDDFASIQRALSVVINAVAAGTLDPARARVLLYGLQIASTNARRMASAPETSRTEEAVRDEKKAAGVKRAVSSPVSVVVSSLEEQQPVLAVQREPESPKREDTEAIADANRSMEAGTEEPTQPATHTALPIIYSGGVRIPPSCFSPASEYSSGARERLLAAKQRAGLSSVG